MKILISGAGIAGCTLAFWLARYGIEAVLVEKAPTLRTGGYVIDYWGSGFDVAQRMGLVDEICGRGYRVEHVRVVNSAGVPIAGFPASAFARATGGRYTSLPRGELAAAIYGAIAGKVETIFNDTIERIQQCRDGVVISFRRSGEQKFDLVVGADGQHSRVRELVFGPEPQFEKYLGNKAAAFEVGGYRPRDDSAYVMYTQVHKQVARFAMRQDRTMFLLTFADPVADGPADRDIAGQKAQLRRQFGKSGWECPQILEAVESVGDLYFDRVSQICMSPDPGWAKGRAILIGDAAAAVSLFAGEGSSLAMAAAYLLAGELSQRRSSYAEAFAGFEKQFGPFVRSKQQGVSRLAVLFAPDSAASLFLRNQFMNLMRIPGIARFAIPRGVTGKIELPDY